MTTYYVAPAANGGSNSNNGLGPDASHATNKPWATIAKAVGAAGMASGDTVYIAPGTYREGSITFTLAPTAETRILGDPTNSRGFKDASGNPLAGGLVMETAYTSSDDKTPDGSGESIFRTNGKNFFTVQDLVINGVNNAVVDMNSVAGSHDWTFRRVVFIQSNGLQTTVNYTGVAGTPPNLLFDQCIFTSAMNRACIAITCPSSGSANYDSGVVIQNCTFLGGGGGTGVSFNSSGASAFKASGCLINHCTFWGVSTGVTVGSLISTAKPVRVANSVFINCSTNCLNATLGNLVEDNNRLQSNNLRTNVSIGPYTAANGFSCSLEFGQSFLHLGQARPAFGPVAGSPFLGVGGDAMAVGDSTAATFADDATVGTIAWTTPSNAAIVDGTSTTASAVPLTTGISHYLKATGFGFAIPAGATIVAVSVEAIVSAAAASAISASSVKLVKGGAISGNDRAATNTTQFGTSLAIQRWGNTTDPLWGLSLTPSDVNASDFGVVFSVKNTSGTNRDANVDMLRVIVLYTNADGSDGVAVDGLNRARIAPYALGAYESDLLKPGISRARAVNGGI